MKYLGVDYGSKRIGLAVSDDGGSMAFPGDTLPNRGVTRAVEAIKNLCLERGISVVVVGHSMTLRGVDNEIEKETSYFCEQLKKAGLSTEREDERYSSVEAERIQGKNEHSDASAAAIILNAFLMRLSNKK